MKILNLKYQPLNKVFRHFFVGIFLIIGPVFAQAQSRMISGSVHDDKNDPLPGVTVTVKGTKEATMTDFTGQYKIKADSKDQLVFTYISYETATATVGDRSTINIGLRSTTSNLDEIVVIGYGTVKRKDLTGSVGSVAMADINKSPIRSFDEALAGRVAGVQVTSSDGRPGSGVSIVIRGNNSVTQSNSPLYVIDGFLIEDPNNNVINPSDIESIDILKDASATAIYGARGANGVIVIQTKRGKQGKPVFDFSSSIGIQNITKKMDVMDTYDFIKYQLEFNPAYASSSPTPTQIYLTGPGKTLEDYKNFEGGTDWQDLVTRTALFKNNNLSVTGGSKKLKYAISGSHTDQDGILLNSNYLRYQGRVNLDYSITDKLKVGINSNYSYLKQTGIDPTAANNTGSGTGNLMTTIWGSRPYDPYATNPEDVFIDPYINSAADYRVNPIMNLENTYNVGFTNSLALNGYLDYILIKGLKIRSTLGYINNKFEKDEFYNSKTQMGRPGSPSGVMGRISNRDAENWLNENTITWDKTIKKSKFIVLGGFTVQKGTTDAYGKGATRLPNESLGLDGLDQGVATIIFPSSSVWTMESFLARVNYSYANKYLLTASYRADGSSKFPSQNHWGYFPSGALTWKFKEESFLKKNKTLSDGKLRFSYGQTGNNRVGDFDYLTSYYSPGNPTYATYVFGDYQYVTGITGQKLGNSDLKWETTEQINAGIDLGFFNQRITFTADVYKKTTKDLLLNTLLPLSTGYSSAFKNIGSVENRGLELTLTTKNIVTKDFTWTSSANISFNRNKLLALAEGQKERFDPVPWDINWFGINAYVSRVGEPLGQMYGFEYAGTYKYADFDTSVNAAGATVYSLKPGISGNGNGVRANIQPGDVRYTDQNGDGTINTLDNVKIGNGNPLNIGGFSNNFTYKAFDLNVFFQWSYGNDIMNTNRIYFDGNQRGSEGLNQFSSYNDRWSSTNPDSNVFRTKGLVGSPVGYSSYYVEDGSYLRFKTIALGYNCSKDFVKKMHLKSLRFSISAQNIYTWTKYSGPDPEVSTYSTALTPGFDFSAYPRARTVFFATNISF